MTIQQHERTAAPYLSTSFIFTEPEELPSYTYYSVHLRKNNRTVDIFTTDTPHIARFIADSWLDCSIEQGLFENPHYSNGISYC